MPRFLTREELYRLLQRELPEGLYADGPPSAFFTTSSIDSKAGTLETAYDNLERIYENYFPQTADEKIKDWIDKAFIGVSFEDAVTLQDKRNRVIAKLRKKPTLALWEVLTLIAGYLPPGKYVQIVENCSASGSWVLGESMLGLTTVLGLTPTLASLGIIGEDWCEFVSAHRGWVLGQSELGVDTDLAEIGFLEVIQPQIQAYGYEIRIFETAVTGTSFDQMERQIKETEPARSVHLIRQNLSLADFGLNNVVIGVDEFDLVSCITIDPASETGYSGRVI